MKSLFIALALTATATSFAQVAKTCYRGSVDGKTVNLVINRHSQGIAQQLSVGDFGLYGDCFRVSQALAMYCNTNAGTMAFGLEYQGDTASMQMLGSVMLSQTGRPQNYIVLEEGTPNGIISLNQVSCK